MAVYIIAVGTSDPPNLVKIGFSTEPSVRLETLQAGHHEPLRIVRLIGGGSMTERWLHLRFEDLRVNREWFTFSPEMLSIEPPPERQPPAARPVRAEPRQLPIGECFVCKRIGPIDDDHMCENGAEHAALLEKVQEAFVQRLIRAHGPGGVERTIAAVKVPNAEYRAALRDLFAEETRQAGLEPVVGPLDMTDYRDDYHDDGELDEHLARRMSKMVTASAPKHVFCSLCERPLTVRPDPAARAWLCADCGSYPVLVQHFREGRARLAEAD